MHVLATAGHVDHGKSTLVRALTGIEPDRWAEEHRRGLTIDLGYAWTTLPSGEEVAFVDVPGHERFIGNMLAGLGPAPAVVFVVAADEGWRAQSSEHLAAVDALGLEHGLLVVTRSDLADPGPALADAGARLAGTSLGECDAVAVSARTGAGLDTLRVALDRLVARLPPPRRDGRVRLWVDRSFTIRGAGTVVTGTLEQGSVAVGDELEVDAGGHRVRVRGVQSLERPHESVGAVARVALNLRGASPQDVPRGTSLLTTGAWLSGTTLDVRLSQEASELPATVTVHVGTAALTAHLRPLGGSAARLALSAPLPLVAGDRAILRVPGKAGMLVGALVLDADPAPLRRRGDARRRAVELEASTGSPDLEVEVSRRGAMTVRHAQALGVPLDASLGSPGPASPSVVRHGDWLVATSALERWAERLGAAVTAQIEADPLDPSLPLAGAATALGLPGPELVPVVAGHAGLEVRAGRVWVQGEAGSLGPAESGLRTIEDRLAQEPFAAPERPELQAAGLGPRELAAAQRLGRVLRLPDDVVLLPSGPARAMRVLAQLPQPFTASEARTALGATRRVTIPLLEHLDAKGWTRRLDGSHRTVVR